jgi:hypothetical protein
MGLSLQKKIWLRKKDAANPALNTSHHTDGIAGETARF